MNKDLIYEQCFEEYSWRYREIKTLFNSAKESDEKNQKILLKSLILIAYAHWEGLVTESLIILLNFLQDKHFTAKEYHPKYLCSILGDRLKRLETNDRAKRRECIEEIIDMIVNDEEVVCSLVRKDVKELIGSNIDAKALVKICQNFHLSTDFLDSDTFNDFKNEIDQTLELKIFLNRLVGLRNAIAHGESSDAFSSLEESQRIVDLYEVLGLEFIDEVEKTFLNKKFLRGWKNG